jgi:hypothetical protein
MMRVTHLINIGDHHLIHHHLRIITVHLHLLSLTLSVIGQRMLQNGNG